MQGCRAKADGCPGQLACLNCSACCARADCRCRPLRWRPSWVYHSEASTEYRHLARARCAVGGPSRRWLFPEAGIFPAIAGVFAGRAGCGHARPGLGQTTCRSCLGQMWRKRPGEDLVCQKARRWRRHRHGAAGDSHRRFHIRGGQSSADRRVARRHPAAMQTGDRLCRCARHALRAHRLADRTGSISTTYASWQPGASAVARFGIFVSIDCRYRHRWKRVTRSRARRWSSNGDNRTATGVRY